MIFYCREAALFNSARDAICKAKRHPSRERCNPFACPGRIKTRAGNLKIGQALWRGGAGKTKLESNLNRLKLWYIMIKASKFSRIS
jgi:hypothetical protein